MSKDRINETSVEKHDTLRMVLIFEKKKKKKTYTTTRPHRDWTHAHSPPGSHDPPLPGRATRG